MPHFLVSATGWFAEHGTGTYMDVIEAESEDQAAIAGIKAYDGHEDMLEWEGPRCASTTDPGADAIYNVTNVQYVSPHNAPILKAYLDNAFPKEQ